MFLSTNELENLTGKIRRPAQQRELQSMGVTHMVRSDGALIVSREHIQKILDGMPVPKIKKKSEPDFSALYAKTQKN